MAKDIQIIPSSSGVVNFLVHGKLEDCGLLLLQRLYVLMFTERSGNYREHGGGLLGFMEGANIPSIDAFNALLALSADEALQGLDSEDRENISSFTATYNGDIITCILKLTDGTTIEGTLNNG